MLPEKRKYHMVSENKDFIHKAQLYLAPRVVYTLTSFLLIKSTVYRLSTERHMTCTDRRVKVLASFHFGIIYQPLQQLRPGTRKAQGYLPYYLVYSTLTDSRRCVIMTTIAKRLQSITVGRETTQTNTKFYRV